MDMGRYKKAKRIMESIESYQAILERLRLFDSVKKITLSGSNDKGGTITATVKINPDTDITKNLKSFLEQEHEKLKKQMELL